MHFSERIPVVTWRISVSSQ